MELSISSIGLFCLALSILAYAGGATLWVCLRLPDRKRPAPTAISRFVAKTDDDAISAADPLPTPVKTWRDS